MISLLHAVIQLLTIAIHAHNIRPWDVVWYVGACTYAWGTYVFYADFSARSATFLRYCTGMSTDRPLGKTPIEVSSERYQNGFRFFYIVDASPQTPRHTAISTTSFHEQCVNVYLFTRRTPFVYSHSRFFTLSFPCYSHCSYITLRVRDFLSIGYIDMYIMI